mmetsp:Transcript_12174/g.19667  ORF Transcript_12174/g.19667 Transcript_12174/m.19667 type:complete len:1288 (+) Transcript_12174:310-4173(+)|eukprot:CAMPEP_0184646100 /NCGR_PEP_ID=MMETSP0308-20130426/2742_1 /TAXON_ID=38269 /ORGANISM="Gloeochaete witrockiana, Strain SAG 46.84" /LENGTH=1287 /DNA_ID=CAMNT_0027075789 /DNA_START=261 /DNA_END=4124 /DNA_ORIENTATION=-
MEYENNDVVSGNEATSQAEKSSYLQDENQRLSTALDQHRHEIARLKEQLRKVTEERDAGTSMVDEISSHVQATIAETESLRRQQEERERQLVQACEERDVLRELVKANQAHDSQDGVQDEGREHLANLEEEVKALQVERNDMRKELSASIDMYEKLSMDLKQSREILETHFPEHEEKAPREDAEAGLVDELRKQLKALGDQLHVIQEDRDRLKAYLKKLKSHPKELPAATSEETAEGMPAEANVVHLDDETFEENMRLHNRVAGLVNDLSVLKVERDDLRKDLSASVDMYEKLSVDLKQSREVLETRFPEQDGQGPREDAEAGLVDELRKQLTALGDQLQAMQEERDRFKAHLKNSKANPKEMTATTGEETTEGGPAEANVVQLDDETLEENMRLHDHVAELANDLNVLKLERGELRKELSASVDMYEKLSMDLKEARGALETHFPEKEDHTHDEAAEALRKQVKALGDQLVGVQEERDRFKMHLNLKSRSKESLASPGTGTGQEKVVVAEEEKEKEGRPTHTENNNNVPQLDDEAFEENMRLHDRVAELAFDINVLRTERDDIRKELSASVSMYEKLLLDLQQSRELLESRFPDEETRGSSGAAAAGGNAPTSTSTRVSFDLKEPNSTLEGTRLHEAMERIAVLERDLKQTQEKLRKAQHELNRSEEQRLGHMDVELVTQTGTYDEKIKLRIETLENETVTLRNERDGIRRELALASLENQDLQQDLMALKHNSSSRVQGGGGGGLSPDPSPSGSPAKALLSPNNVPLSSSLATAFSLPKKRSTPVAVTLSERELHNFIRERREVREELTATVAMYERLVTSLHDARQAIEEAYPEPTDDKEDKTNGNSNSNIIKSNAEAEAAALLAERNRLAEGMDAMNKELDKAHQESKALREQLRATRERYRSASCKSINSASAIARPTSPLPLHRNSLSQLDSQSPPPPEKRAIRLKGKEDDSKKGAMDERVASILSQLRVLTHAANEEHRHACLTTSNLASSASSTAMNRIAGINAQIEQLMEEYTLALADSPPASPALFSNLILQNAAKEKTQVQLRNGLDPSLDIEVVVVDARPGSASGSASLSPLLLGYGRQSVSPFPQYATGSFRPVYKATIDRQSIHEVLPNDAPSSSPAPAPATDPAESHSSSSHSPAPKKHPVQHTSFPTKKHARAGAGGGSGTLLQQHQNNGREFGAGTTATHTHTQQHHRSSSLVPVGVSNAPRALLDLLNATVHDSPSPSSGTGMGMGMGMGKERGKRIWDGYANILKTSPSSNYVVLNSSSTSPSKNRHR